MIWPFNRGRAPAPQAAARREPVLAPAAPHNTGATPASAGTYGSEFFSYLAGGLSRSGMAVNEQTAMSIATVYACVGLIGGALASMPLHTYKRDGDSRQRADHALWPLFNTEPWPALTAAVFWEYAAWSLLLHGDAFARIQRASRLSPVIQGFEPLHPLLVTVQRNGDRLVYMVQREAGRVETLDQDDMLHVPGIGFNGLRGMSTLRFALRNPAGIALAADEMSGAYFRQGGKTDVALVAPGKLSDDQVRQMQENWVANQGPISSAFIPLILSGGVQIQHLGISAEDAQLLSTRKMQVEEICRIFRVPPFMVGQTEKTTSFGQGIEQMGIGFVKYTLQSHLVKFEQEINRKCFRSPKYFAEFNTAGLERGDMASRYESYRIALGRAGEQPWMTANEVRQLENLPATKLSLNPGATDAPDAAETAAAQ